MTFIQVIRGPAPDRFGIRGQFDRSADVGALFSEVMSAVAVDGYLDLKDPWNV